MFRRRRTASRHRRSNHSQNLLHFMRKPYIQVAIIIFSVLVIAILALGGQKAPAGPDTISTTVSTDVSTDTPLPAATVSNLPGVISVSQAYALYVNHSAYILDVRERSEWDLIHIPSTTLLPLGQVAGLVDKFPTDKTIIVVSAADTRSQQARDYLINSGYSNVTSMTGGINYWKAQGFPVEP